MSKLRTTTATVALILTAGLSLAPLSAQADTLHPPTAVQPDGCTPGYIHIDYVPGVDWTLDGKPVEVKEPSTDFPFPSGFEDAVIAAGAEAETYGLTVDPIPSSCWPDPTPTPKPEDADASGSWPCTSQVAWYSEDRLAWIGAYNQVVRQNGHALWLVRERTYALRDANRSIERLERRAVRQQKRLNRKRDRIEQLEAEVRELRTR